MPRGKSAASMRLIQAAYDILAEVQPATVRAVCYRLFIAGVIPSMGVVHTKRVSAQLVYAREAGIIPWNWIVDETREPERVAQWSDPEQYAEVVQRSYRRNRWQQQPRIVEVWSEKATIRGTLAPVLNAYAITFRVYHGFGSATSVDDVATENSFDGLGCPPLLALYAGDLDPSGAFMSDVDLPTRLQRYGGNVQIRRVAIHADDTRDGLPKFSVEDKRGDRRYAWFKATYGTWCWEVDALNPNTLRDRIERAIVAELDVEAWQRAARVEAVERASLHDVLEQWRSAKHFETSPEIPERSQ